MIEDVEDGVDELPYSYFSKAAVRVFDEKYNRNNGAFPLSKFVDFIETLGEGFHSEELAGHLRKVDPNESGSLESFSFVRWYVGEKVSMESTEESELFMGFCCNVSPMDLH